MDKYQVVCEHDPLTFILSLRGKLDLIARSATPCLAAAHLNIKTSETETVIEALLITADSHTPGAVRINP